MKFKTLKKKLNKNPKLTNSHNKTLFQFLLQFYKIAKLRIWTNINQCKIFFNNDNLKQHILSWKESTKDGYNPSRRALKE